MWNDYQFILNYHLKKKKSDQKIYTYLILFEHFLNIQ